MILRFEAIVWVRTT